MAQRLVAAAAALALAVCANLQDVSAHASLQHCSIKNNQVFRLGHAPRAVTATFAEPLDPRNSWMKVFEGGADHGLVEPERSSVSYKNPSMMTLTLPRLGKEKYYLIWYTHSAADNHVAAGIVYFQVK